MKITSAWMSGLVLLALVAAGCSKHGSEPAPAAAGHRAEKQAVAVTVAQVAQRLLERTVSIVGTFSGQEEVVIAPKADGRVIKIHHDVGDIVRPGEVLLEIDETDYSLAVEEARRAFESELAKLGLAKLPPENWDLNKLPAVDRTRLLVAHAKQKADRVAALAERNMNTKDDQDQAETDLKVAQANYRQALMDARSTLATARHKYALLATADQHRKDTKLIVPTGGSVPPGVSELTYVVSQRMISEGEMVQAKPATESFRLVMDNPLKLKATVPERHVSDIRVGLAVRIEVEAYPQRSFSGEVARVNPTVDRTNRTFQLEIRVPNEERELKPGNFAKAWIVTAGQTQALCIPREALVSFAGINKVFVIRNGKAQAVEVTIGKRGEDWLEVTGELTADEPVVTSGQTHLADGTSVRMRDGSPAVAPAATPAAETGEGLTQR